MRSVLSLVVIAALSTSARADQVDDILAKNYAARGGEKLRALKSVRFTGRIAFGGADGQEAEWALVIARPGKLRSEVTLQGLTQVSAFDGRESWNMSPFSGRRDAEHASQDDARQAAREADLDGALVDARVKGNRIEYLGTEDVDGTLAWKLRVTRKDGDVQYVFLDPDSALEIRITNVHKVRGVEEMSDADYGSYHQVGGAWFPFSIEVGAHNGPRNVHVMIERADANIAADDAWFKFPSARVARVVMSEATQKAAAEPFSPPTASGPVVVDAGTISGLGARNIGSAAMSGRVSAVAAVNVDGKTTIYVGAASGGVWRSYDGGTTFKPVFDRQPVQSIGAITIDPSNPKTIWVGTGEAWTRNSVSIGDGIYRSTDAGETWTNMGLRDSERIARILVHPRDPSTVYACVPGKLWSDSQDRGLYKTSDGGRTWKLVLAGANLSTGCSGVTMDPKNPDALIAGMWDFRRKGWTFRSGGDGPNAPSGSAMLRTSDGGRTWQTVTTAKGLPAMPWGRVEVAYAPSDSKVVYAMIESKDSALYRSNDGGATWEQRDKSQAMVWRPFYFARLVIDPTNPNRLFKPDGNLIVSEDGGRSFANSSGASHGDWHDLWIDPQNPKHVIGGDDGGFWMAFDGGNRWFKSNNLPISQFYHVTVDDKDPYRVYGGLQDNSSWVGDTSYPGGITNSRWENLCNSDGFHTLVDPSDAEAVYCEAQGGYILRVDRRTMAARDIQPKAGYHEKLRYNWNTPIASSPTQKGVLYIGAQFLFRSRDRGDTWQRISPDLTTNDPEKQKQEQSGGVTVDNSSAEMHTTIFAIAEAPKDPNTIWVGTDDGNVQLTRDGGKTWTNLTGNIAGLPASSWVTSIEPSRHDAGTAYATFDRHTFGDMNPWVYVTHDFGKTWKRIVGEQQAVRGYAHVIKEDPVKRGLLYLGTELGLWMSLDGGDRWAKFDGGHLPAVAVRDLAIQTREHDLVLGTHGRGMWIIDDLTPLRALADDVLQKTTAFLPTRPPQQRVQPSGGWVEGDATFIGDNPPNGVVVTYYLRARHVYGPIKLEILDAAGKLVDDIAPSKHRGLNRVVWNMRVKPPRVPRAAQVAGASTQGPRVAPGTYTLRLTRGTDVVESKVAIGIDRRAPYTVADRKTHFDAMMRVHALFGDTSKLIDRIESLRGAIVERERALPANDPLKAKLDAVGDKLEALRTKIVATKEGGAITGEERIREHLDLLYGALGTWEGRPAKTLGDRTEVLRRELGDVGKAFDALVSADVRALDGELKQHKLAPIPAMSVLLKEHDEEEALDDHARRCIASWGRQCEREKPAVATERD